MLAALPTGWPWLRTGHFLNVLGVAGALLVQAFAPSHASPTTVAERVAERRFPSVFQAWNPADNLGAEPAIDAAARHDLLWNLPEYFGLRWNSPYRLLGDGFVDGTPENALKMRAGLLERNPSMVLLAELRYHDSPDSDLPASSSWWQRDSAGQRVLGWAEGDHYLLDWHNSALRAQIAHQAQALVRSGVVDGIFLDWWGAQADDDPDRLSLLQEVRDAIGPDALILINSNWTIPERSAPYVNGLYMETAIPRTTDEAAEWRQATETLLWAEANLRKPTLNAFETWTCSAEPPFAVPCTDDARNALNRMRATTTLALTYSNGYALFADANGLPTPDHLHNWYPFWDQSLGRAVGGAVRRSDGAVQREFEQGTAVYNAIDNSAVEVKFDAPRRSAATGQVASSFTLAAFDGDLYLTDVAS
jgi:Hypothetical glycosyl hydrolase family 15